MIIYTVTSGSFLNGTALILVWEWKYEQWCLRENDISLYLCVYICSHIIRDTMEDTDSFIAFPELDRK